MFARENFSALVVVCSGCGNGIASREEIYEYIVGSNGASHRLRTIYSSCLRSNFLGYSNFFKNCIFHKIDRFKRIRIRVKSKLKPVEGNKWNIDIKVD